ncbi:MAG: hypothetical protein GSR82_06040 [Desulfurococcales archaeon]|nr:hypothetical protein [Desulfurococcales archaeon]
MSSSTRETARYTAAPGTQYKTVRKRPVTPALTSPLAVNLEAQKDHSVTGVASMMEEERITPHNPYSPILSLLATIIAKLTATIIR